MCGGLGHVQGSLHPRAHGVHRPRCYSSFGSGVSGSSDAAVVMSMHSRHIACRPRHRPPLRLRRAWEFIASSTHGTRTCSHSRTTSHPAPSFLEARPTRTGTARALLVVDDAAGRPAMGVSAYLGADSGLKLLENFYFL
ncbi:hypothetical protein D1007_00132 [Hordeum vulgare]|nr:hypothetical protein D1007_00132 [Hordeum vulgare]